MHGLDNITRLYHGSVYRVETPDTKRSNSKNDFGVGFYTTANRDEALDWALKKSRFSKLPAILNEYEFVPDDDITFYEFERNDLDDLLWLDFILKNRGYDDFIGFTKSFEVLKRDILIGPIANNKLAIQMNMLTSGLIEGDTLEDVKHKFIGLLMPSRLDNQLCFKNDFATDHLRFIEAEQC
jgi:hypothetical protein